MKRSVFFSFSILLLSIIVVASAFTIPYRDKAIPVLKAGAEGESTYSFDHEVKMKMTSYTENEADNTFDYLFMFTDEGNYMGMEGNFTQGGQAMMMKGVFDMENQTMILLMDNPGMKMGMEMNITPSGTEINEDQANINVRKTGRTKTILGKSCTEYEMTNEGSYSLVWVTPDVKFGDYYEIFKAMDKKNKRFSYRELPEGFMMEMTMWPEGKEGTARIHMEVTEINRNKSNTISTEGYQIMKMNR